MTWNKQAKRIDEQVTLLEKDKVHIQKRIEYLYDLREILTGWRYA